MILDDDFTLTKNIQESVNARKILHRRIKEYVYWRISQGSHRLYNATFVINITDGRNDTREFETSKTLLDKLSTMTSEPELTNNLLRFGITVYTKMINNEIVEDLFNQIMN